MTTQDKIKVLIERAVEGGYTDSYFCDNFDVYEGQGSHCEYGVLLDPDFYKALDKARGERCFACVRDKRWSTEECGNCEGTGLESNWKRIGLDFHEINLTQSFEAGIDYLYNLVEKK